MYFPSKKDAWLGLIIWGSVLLVASIYIFEDDSIGLQIYGFMDIVGFILILLTITFLLWVWYGTGYKIEKGLIKIKSGPFRSSVKINEIKKIRATKNPLSAPALSIDRIEILYGKYDMTLISPINKLKFIEYLVTENPEIKIDKNTDN